MNVISLFTMILVLGTIWGGLIYFIIRAVKYEKEKAKIGKE